MALRQASVLECARQARRSMGLIRQRLLNPTPKVLENCVPHLRVAIECLSRLQDLLASPTAVTFGIGALRSEMAGLRRELGDINALMTNAAVFYAGLAELLGTRSDEDVGYTVTGAIIAPKSPMLRVEG